jgi:hypothetical protein
VKDDEDDDAEEIADANGDNDNAPATNNGFFKAAEEDVEEDDIDLY